MTRLDRKDPIRFAGGDANLSGNLLRVVLPAAGGTIDYVVDGTNRRIGKRVNGCSRGAGATRPS